ncbi:unnamed protein product [Brassica oleracea var. botrytis]|uniref:(rape) hypothetical protein n=1 Tax=Brassica napus TaxID=3708 RepID=A0A816KLV5_BRANA|nr:unnamed protein product [Brassica napus]
MVNLNIDRYGAKTAEATNRQTHGLEQQGMLLERSGQFSRSGKLSQRVCLTDV